MEVTMVVTRWLRDEELEGMEQVLHVSRLPGSWGRPDFLQGGSDGRSVVELVRLLRRNEKM